jgi:hypothetical protein
MKIHTYLQSYYFYTHDDFYSEDKMLNIILYLIAVMGYHNTIIYTYMYISHIFFSEIRLLMTVYWCYLLIPLTLKQNTV